MMEPSESMSFSEALEAMKEGERVARLGWNGKGMFVFRVAGSRFAVNREPLLSILGEGTEVNYRAHYDLRAADGTVGVWTPSSTDLDAEDWVLV